MKWLPFIYFPAHTALQRFFLRIATRTGCLWVAGNSIQEAVSAYEPVTGSTAFSRKGLSISIL